MRVRVLGEIEAEDASVRRSLTPQARRVLASLVAAVLAGNGQGISKGQLADDLGSREPVAVRMAVSRLRKLLGDRVVTTRQGYRLDLAGGDWLDASAFERLLNQGRDAVSAAARVAALSEALGLWRGEAFGTEGDVPTVEPVRARLDSLRRTAIEDLAAAMLDVGRAEEAILLLEQHRDELRYCERPIELLLRAHASLGRIAEALRTYERFRIELRDDVGVAPSSELRAVEARLLHDEASGPSQRVGPRAPEGVQAAMPLALRGVRLPVPLTALIGRDEEVRHVARTLRANRLVTLVGVGGCGKTRLAIEIARALADPSARCVEEADSVFDVAWFDEGPWFVALADLGDPALTARAIARAMGRHDPIVGDDPNQIVDELIRSIGGARVLLVMDNCEHLLAGCSASVSQLVNGCPALRVLATSREPLHIVGERVIDVGPLATPITDTFDAVANSAAGALLVERARATSSDFDFDERTAPIIAALCRRLDGLPLALELAAAGLRGRTARQLLDSLTSTSSDLAGAHGATPHHDSMRTALRWSTDLLSREERRLFQRLAVFRGGFRLDAAEAVGVSSTHTDARTGSDVTVPTGIASLVDKCLVIRDSDSAEAPRYRLLEVVRDFALTLLTEDGELEDANCRHRDHFTDRSALVRVFERGTPGFDDLRLELGNVRAAIDWSQQHHDTVAALDLINKYPCWQDLGLVDEHDHLLTAALGKARPGDVPVSSLAQALQMVSITRTYRGDVVGADAPIGTLNELVDRHPDMPDVRGHRSFAAATRSYLFRDGDIQRGHRQMSRAQHDFDLTGTSGAYPAGNQLFAAVLFGVPPSDGISSAVEDALSRAVASHGPVIEITIHALVALWQQTWEHHGSIARCNELLEELVALGSGWEGNLLTLLVAHARESAGDTHGAARGVADYLRFASASGLRIFVADALRSTARLIRAHDPDQAIRVWSASDCLAAATGLREIAILCEQDRAAHDHVASVAGPDRVRQAEEAGQRWTLAVAMDVATAELDKIGGRRMAPAAVVVDHRNA